MKSITLEIVQIEVQPDKLHWKVSSPGQSSVSGVFRIDAENEAARYLACAAHAFQTMGIFGESKGVEVIYDGPLSRTEKWQALIKASLGKLSLENDKK